MLCANFEFLVLSYWMRTAAHTSKVTFDDNKPIRHLSFRYRFWPKYKVTSTWIGRIDMPCAHAQWV